jgi:hypothetical protein
MVRKIHTWIQQYHCGALAVIAATILLHLLPPAAAAAFLSIPLQMMKQPSSMLAFVLITASQ